MKKNVKYIIIALIIVILCICGFIFFKSNKQSDEPSKVNSDNNSNITDNKEDKDTEQDKQDDNIIYKIYYSEYTGALNFYAAFIDKDYKLYTVKIEENNREYLDRDEEGHWILNNTDYILEIKDRLDKSTLNSVNLSNENKEYLKKLLNTLEYSKDSNNSLIFYNLYINNNEDKSFISEHKYGNDLANLVAMIINNDVSYLDQVQNNDAKKYIKDTNIKELNYNSNLIEELYSKVNSTAILMDYYVHNKITNDTIITLTLREMQKNEEYLVEEMDDDLDEDDYWFPNLYFLMDKFDIYAKELFGPNVVYDIASYNGYGNGCSSYYVNLGKLIMSGGSGCGAEEFPIYTLAYAYEVDDKIVIIEKSLYMTYGDCGESTPCYADTYGLKEGIYNNITDRKLLTTDYLFDIDVDILNEYSKDATYYSYTFTKTNEGKYYYTDFKKLN